MLNLVQRLLNKNQISFDKEELNFQIQSHPSYPSLHAITGVLDHFNIENIAVDVPATKEVLAQLPDCFIAQINSINGKYLVIVERKKTAYLIFNSEGKKERISEKDFLEKFTGVVVGVEPSDDNKQVKINFNVWQIISLISIIFISSFLAFKMTNSWYTLAYLLLSIMGVFASIAIIKQELGLKSTIGDAFCSGGGEKKDCDAVLTSKGAEIIKGYKLSDFSILYFVGLSLLTFIQLSNPVISFTISLLAIPITLYSLYYQYAIVKKWCLLCLSIVGVLWLQALVPVISNTFIIRFNINDFLVFGLVGTSILLAWNNFKPLFTEVYHLRKEKIESTKFKRNFSLFKGFLQKSPQINTQLQNSSQIIFGNPESSLEIVIVTNPFCGHCKPLHRQIDKILKQYHSQVKIIIRFNISVEDINSNAYKITSKLIELKYEKGEENCLKAMGDIYGKMSPSKWLEKWGVCNQKYTDELKNQKEWCTKNGINFTPEILINGKSFPKEYKREDLSLFIEDLHEDCHNKKSQINTVHITE